MTTPRLGAEQVPSAPGLRPSTTLTYAQAQAELRLGRSLTRGELAIDIEQADADLAEGKRRLAAAIEKEKRRAVEARLRGVVGRMAVTHEMVLALRWLYGRGRTHALDEMGRLGVEPRQRRFYASGSRLARAQESLQKAETSLANARESGDAARIQRAETRYSDALARVERAGGSAAGARATVERAAVRIPERLTFQVDRTRGLLGGIQLRLDREVDAAIFENGGVHGLLAAEVERQIPGALAAAAELVPASFTSGVADVYEAHSELFAGWQYSAVMDEATCDECAGADGEEFATLDELYAVLPDFGPNPSCDGGDRCRCRGVPIAASD